MPSSQPAHTPARRGRSTLLVIGLAGVALLVATTSSGANRFLRGGREGAAPATPWPTVSPKGQPPAVWPERGQAAYALGDAQPAASPDEGPVPIASLAKLMTAYLTLAQYPLSGIQDGFTLIVTAPQARAESQDAAQHQSVVAVRAGEQLTERQLLEALLIPSGNNIATMLAVRVAGTVPGFVDAMNAEARALGMDHTTYTDPSGFDPATVSTAADQVVVLRHAMQSPAFRQIVSMSRVTLPVAGTVTNYNPLIARGYAGKTGSDAAAGGCLAFFTGVTAGGGRVTLAGVVLGQGEGSATPALLAAAARAAEQLVDSVAGGPVALG